MHKRWERESKKKEVIEFTHDSESMVCVVKRVKSIQGLHDVLNTRYHRAELKEEASDHFMQGVLIIGTGRLRDKG